MKVISEKKRREKDKEREEKKQMKEKNEKNRQRNRLLNQFETDTGFEVICCCCNQFKCKNKCTKAKRLSLEEHNTYLLKDEAFNLSKDNEFYVCNICFKKIKAKNMSSNKDMFQWSNFPKSLLQQVKERSKIDEKMCHTSKKFQM